MSRNNDTPKSDPLAKTRELAVRATEAAKKYATLVKNEKGQGLVEYAFMLVVVLMIAAVVVPAVTGADWSVILTDLVSALA